MYMPGCNAEAYTIEEHTAEMLADAVFAKSNYCKSAEIGISFSSCLYVSAKMFRMYSDYVGPLSRTQPQRDAI